MNTIITTVGTSVYSNLLKKEITDFYKNNFNTQLLTNDDFNRYNNKDWNRDNYNENIFNQIENNIFNNWMLNVKIENNVPKIEDNYLNTNCSAEIKTLSKIEDFDKHKHYLLTTDTAISLSAANLIKRFLKEKCNINDDNIVIESITGLQVHNPVDFKNIGMNNLIAKIKEIKDDAKGEEVILNISGGYKALIPILTIIGQLENIPLKYIYEDSNELIEIPDLQIDFDFTFIEEYYNAFELLKKEPQNLPTKEEFLKIIGNNYEYSKFLEKDKIIEEFTFNNNEKVRFSYLGKLIFNKYEELYNKKLLHRQNLVSKLVEMYLYEYFVKKYSDKVTAGKKVGEKNYDIDVYIENDNYVRAIEVKPGGHIPSNDIISVFKEKSFKWLIDNKPNNKKLTLEVVLYHYKEPINDVINYIKMELIKLDQYKNCEVIFTWLILEPKYKTNMNWEVSEERLKTLFKINNSIN